MMAETSRELFERWHSVVDRCGSGVAVFDGQKQWTFDELRELTGGEAGEPVVRCASGNGLDFILTVLRAWRDGAVLWPQDSVARSAEGKIAASDLPKGIVHLKSTSGTSGVAKIVMLRAKALESDASQIVETMGMCESRVNLSVISLAHSYGFSNLVLPLLLHGVPIRFADSPLPAAVGEALALVDGKCTLAAVPAMWLAWHRAGVLEEFGGKNITAISAGAPLPLELEKEVYASCGLKIHNFYGASECGGIAYDDSSSPRKDPSYIGRVMPAANVTVNSEGCLEVRGDAVASGYHGGIGSDILGNGVFRTSDLATVNGDEVFLTGRVDDMINVAGRKVSPRLVEEVLLTSPMVKEVLVFGVDCADQAREQQIVAVVSPLSSRKEVMVDLKTRCGKALASWQCPREWWITSDLAADGRGKLSRTAWRKKWLERDGDSKQATSSP